jgi:chromosome segregation ATPase
MVRCLMPEAYDLYEHLRRQAIGGADVPTRDAQAARPAADQVDPAALARYTIEEWARASRATVRERKLLAEVSAAAEREARLTAGVAAATADRDRLAAQLATTAGEHQRLARTLEHGEREMDWLVHERQQLNAESERLALALAEATSGPLHRLAGWFQGRSSTGRAA